MNGLLPLEVESLAHGFKETVFKNASFSLGPGEFATVVVENSVAKSALLDCLHGNLKPAAGRIRFWGRENRGYQRELIQQEVGWVISKKEAHAPWISVREYLLATGRLYRTWNKDLCQHLIQKLALKLDNRMSSLAPLDELKIRLIRALSFEPKLLVLDDVTAGLTSDAKKLILDTLFEQYSKGRMSIVNICLSPLDTARFSKNVFVLQRPGAGPDPGPDQGTSHGPMSGAGVRGINASL